jgi:hypothetical protein
LLDDVAELALQRKLQAMKALARANVTVQRRILAGLTDEELEAVVAAVGHGAQPMASVEAMRDNRLVVPVDGRGDHGGGVVLDQGFDEQIDVAAAGRHGHGRLLTEWRLRQRKAVDGAQLEHEMSMIGAWLAYARFHDTAGYAAVARRVVTGVQRDAFEQVRVEDAGDTAKVVEQRGLRSVEEHRAFVGGATAQRWRPRVGAELGAGHAR